LTELQKKKRLEAKLTPQQRKAALLLVENELINNKAKTQQQLAEEIGVDRVTLYRWRTQNQNFVEYTNILADEFLSAHRAEVYAQLLKLIRGVNGVPSVKAIDTYLKRFGLLTERHVIETDVEGEHRTNEDLAKELEELDDLLDDDDAVGGV
jgi:transposase-like protein